MKFFIERYSRRKVEENPLWLVVLSDIMTNLMLFFLILYVFSIHPETEAKAIFVDGFDKEAQKLKEKKAEEVVKKFTEEDIARKLAEELLKAGLKDMAEVQITDKQIRINIAAPVLFASGKARLGRSASEVLAPVALVLNKLPNDIIVEGHTDGVPVKSGDYPTNWELSAARSDAVVSLLASKYSVPQERMIAAAYGEHRPVASNGTAAGRARNRRIEIILARK
ncbi:MAG: OmpA family protein [Elusimicrobia bacterium]|nr:OmpA family protein [Elusimicrobiota bacterium]